MRARGIFLSVLLIISTSGISVENKIEWPLWQHFQKEFILTSGRVNDPYGGLDITTSEGQSYAMFFAIVNNQPELFEKLLTWTEIHLAKGNLANNLPSWKWKKHKSGVGEVVDHNSASDSDLWILYALLEASRLWSIPRYQRLADQLANTILQNEVYFVTDVGYFLLPGNFGFVTKEKKLKLNPSYVPMQLMDYFSAYLDNSKWSSLQQTSLLLTMESSPLGFAPDWINYKLETGTFSQASVGSYNAIRVYLWAGMLAEDNQHWPLLKNHFAKAAQFVNKLNGVPETINTQILAYKNLGNIGFDISFLPLVSRLQYPHLLQKIQSKVNTSDVMSSNSYYQTALALFGLGWMEKRYKFSDSGELIVSWQDEK